MTTTPRLLLVEDDPTSRAFLEAALRALPAHVDCAPSLATAATLARAHRYDLWLIDAHLPDGSGAQLLALLRANGDATPALAHTAATDPAVVHALHAQGFDEVIAKPLAAAQLRRTVARHLALALDLGVDPSMPAVHPADTLDARDDPPPVWDDVAAAAALNGNDAHVAALRGLFLAELPGVRDAIVEALQSGDVAALTAQLHRLRASCGFTGAALLAAAARALHARGSTADALRDFESAVARTLASEQA